MQLLEKVLLMLTCNLFSLAKLLMQQLTRFQLIGAVYSPLQ